MEETAGALANEGWMTFVLDGAKMGHRRAVFATIRQVLPLDPPIESDRSWDALADSLWGGIDALEAKRVAIIWKNCEAMARRAPEDFEIVLGILRDLSDSLGDPEPTGGRPKEVCIIVG